MQPGDLPAVLEVLRRSLGETAVLQRTPELWNWKHELNPFGRSLVLLAWLDGKVAGVRALMRWDLITPAGETLRCLRAVDTATDPDFKRRGIFSTLTRAAVEQATTDCYDMIFNTPNQASGPGYLKMGWTEVGRIGVMARPLLRTGVEVGDEALPDPEDFFAAPVAPAGSPLEDRHPLGLRTPRTADYSKWRFAGHPNARYREVATDSGVAIVRPNVRSGRKELVISELAGEKPASAVRRVSRIARARYIAAWFSPGTPERRAAVAGGVLPVPGMKALTLVANPLRELPVDVTAIDTWDLSLGDLELL